MLLKHVPKYMFIKSVQRQYSPGSGGVRCSQRIHHKKPPGMSDISGARTEVVGRAGR